MAKHRDGRAEPRRGGVRAALAFVALAIAGCDARDRQAAAQETGADTVPGHVFAQAYLDGWAASGAPVPKADTRYVPSASLAHALLEQRLASGPDWPAGLPGHARSGALRDTFRRQMRRYGLDPDDIADVHAAYRAIRLAIDDGQALTPERMQALARQMRRKWTALLALEPMSARARQRMGEAVLLDAALLGARHAAQRNAAAGGPDSDAGQPLHGGSARSAPPSGATVSAARKSAARTPAGAH